MKIFKTIIFTAFLAGQMGLVAGGSETFVIAKSGRAASSLVLLPNAGMMAEQAYGDLVATLKTMTGVSFEKENTPGKIPCVVVGLASEWAKLTNDQEPLKRLESAAPESFLLRSTSSRLLILGRDSNGVSHGVYTLLRDLGCRWYFISKDWEVIPRTGDILVQADRVEGPAMKVRILSNGAGSGASSRLFENWCRRNRLGSAYGPQAVSHSYAGYVPKELFKTHPEYFAWVSKDGYTKGDTQNGEQPCTTHPEVVKMFKEGALAKLRKRFELTGEKPPIISVSPNDGTPNMCRCERCMAVGSYGDCALLLANQVAETIHAEFPDTLVGFLAYGRASALPINIKQAHSNVLVSVAAGFNWKTSVPRLIEEWPKVVRHVTVYEYYAIGSWGSQAPDNTQPNVEAISKTVRSWHGKGIEGINGEMENDWASCGHRLWAFTEFSWNPALTPDSVMNDFYAKCWGEAAIPMKRYYERWESGQKASPRVLRLALKDLDEAARLARSPDLTHRIDQLSVYLYWHLLNREFKEAKDEEAKNQIALEGDLLQYRWRDSFMVQLIGSIFNVDRPAKIGFAPAEVAGLRTAALHRFLPTSGPDVDLARPVGLENLVPMREVQDLKLQAKGDTEQGFLSTVSYLFRAKAGEPVQIVFEPETSRKKAAPVQSSEAASVTNEGIDRDPLPMNESSDNKMGRFQLWFLGRDGKMQDFILEKNPPPSNGNPLCFDFTAMQEGLYRLNVKIEKGGVLADFKGRPHVLSAAINPRGNLLRLEKESDRNIPKSKGAHQTCYYFYVPRGTHDFLVEASVPGRNKVPVTFRTGSGNVIVKEAGDASKECLVPVAEGEDGGVWSLSTDADRGRIALGGIPPWVATRPENLLVPKE